MATNFNGLRRTKDVLLEIEKRVKALKLSDGLQPAFQTVGLFDVIDLEEALRTFLGARDRVAVIVFDGDHFENEVRGTDLDSAQTRKFDVLVSDRVISSDRRKALFGMDAEHPGVMELQDIVLEELSGLLLANPKGIFCRPLGSQSLTVSDKQAKEQPGRRGRVVSFEARGGLLTKDLGKGPIQ